MVGSKFGRIGNFIDGRLAVMFWLFISIVVGIPVSHAQSSRKAVLGRWDLDLKSSPAAFPSWIEISEVEGQPRIITVSHPEPLPQAEVKGGEIQFLLPKNVAPGYGVDLMFKGKLEDGRLVGTATSANGKSFQWVGGRAPGLKRKEAPQWGKPITLFNGKDFTGWRFRDPSHAGGWKVENGTMISGGGSTDIITTAKFEDFKLHVEFNCGPQSNSGVYLRGRYEVQVETDSLPEPPSHHMGGIYGFVAPSPELPRRPGVWQNFDITLVGRTITVVQNGKTIIDHKDAPGITTGALDSHEELPGPIFLQGGESGRLMYRNIVLTPAEYSR